MRMSLGKRTKQEYIPESLLKNLQCKLQVKFQLSWRWKHQIIHKEMQNVLK